MSTNYEQFMKANDSMMACFKAVPAEEFSAMSLNDQQNVCKNEAAAVKGFLANGQISFSQILGERINALKE